MSNYILHNGTFVEVSDEELMHWGDYKYIKREWKNGRWVYYYEDEEEIKLKAEHKKAQEELKTAKKNAREAAVRYQQAHDDVYKPNGVYNRNAKPSAEQTENINRAEKESVKAQEEYRKAANKASAVAAKYYEKLYITFPEKTIYAGKVASSYLLNGSMTQEARRNAASGALKGAASATNREDSKRTARSNTKKPPKSRTTKRRTR